MAKNQRGFGVIAVVVGLAIILSVPFFALMHHFQSALRVQSRDDFRDDLNKIARVTSRSLIVQDVCTENLILNGLVGRTPTDVVNSNLNLHYGDGAGGLGGSIFDLEAATWRGSSNLIWGVVSKTMPRSATSALMEVNIVGEIRDERWRAKASTIFLLGLDATGKIATCVSTTKNPQGIIMEDVICETRFGSGQVYSPMTHECEAGSLVSAASLGDF